MDDADNQSDCSLSKGIFFMIKCHSCYINSYVIGYKCRDNIEMTILIKCMIELFML